MLPIDDLITIMVLGFFTGFGIEFSKWFFEQLRRNGGELLKVAVKKKG
jgi:hypothetical protein